MKKKEFIQRAVLAMLSNKNVNLACIRYKDSNGRYIYIDEIFEVANMIANRPELQLEDD